MHIKELVLDNFKSFGRKTRIPFYDDFTTISGPNGSGKSNIIDSILFALGLARTSGIRAEKLTDLIYTPGHEDDEREIQGEREASVEVVLDNSDRTLTRSQVVNAAGTEKVGDVDEISVRRRVKETEDNYYSYYYLNGRSVNLSDIQDLLSQAGVTPEGYNVVMQGDVTEIISMTPHARREILDEIAGVAEFDQKKEAAFEELDVVEDRIEEADLRIEEKETRLDQLEDERETALQYQELRDEKEEYEGYLKAAELEEKRKDLTAVRKTVSDLEDDLEAERRELDERQGRVTRLEEDLADLNAEIERKGEDEQLAIKREIEEVKGEINRLQNAVEAAEERIQEAENKRSQAFVKIDRKEEQVEELEGDVRDIKVQKSSIKADVQELEADLAEVEAEIESVDTEYEEVKDALAEKRDALQAAERERERLQEKQDRLLDEARSRAADQREKEEEIEAAKAEIPDIEAEIDDLERELEKAEANRDTISDVVTDLREEKRELQAELDDVEDELNAAQQEYAELEARSDDAGSSYGRAVSTVLNGDLDGVHGTVAQLGGVSTEHATACETAAGGRLAHVVVDDDGVGQRCIEFLKSRNAGRATFLPITKMQQRGLPSLPNHEGVVDFAYNLVDFDSQYAGIFSYVLGDTLVVDDIETARDLMGDYRLVTREGELVEKSGAMTGGSSSGSRYSFTGGGKGQLERLADKIAELEEERREYREEVRDVEDRLEDARDRKADAADQVREIETEIERRDSALADVEERIDRLQAELANIEDERESVTDEMDEIESAIDEQTEEIESLAADIEELETELADSEIPELTSQAEDLREEIADREAEMDDLDARLNELQLERQYAEEAIDELHDDIETAQNRKAEAESDIEEFEAEIGDQEDLLAEKRAAVEELEDELADLKGERADLKETLAAAKGERDEQQSVVTDLENRRDEQASRAERLEWEVEELESEVGDYDSEDVPDHETVVERVEDLEAEMAELEPVNMLAIDEYDEVADQLADLEEKRDTLAEERDGIQERIEQYEARKKETFMEAFEGIDEQFQEIFAQLSNGSGELHLENEDDPFDGGLTMKAQPADKPVQRLDAMSGGEKSLTALAFIFAIQRYNPAPFYALDEVDAFLDAANAELVGELVDDLAGDAQFVVVSHRSALLERSERAIGVTMQGDNISAVTGIDLSEQGVPADD